MLSFCFTPFPALQTERLLLRKLLPSDAPAMFFLRSDPQVLQYLGREPQQSEEEALAFIDKINAAVDHNESVLWGIAKKETPGSLIGTICFWNLQPDRHRAETGYVLHPQEWRKGIMQEALRSVIEYGFTHMKLHSIEAGISPDNTASARLLESCGFIREGYFRESFYENGRFTDSAVYSLLTPFR